MMKTTNLFFPVILFSSHLTIWLTNRNIQFNLTTITQPICAGAIITSNPPVNDRIKTMRARTRFSFGRVIKHKYHSI